MRLPDYPRSVVSVGAIGSAVAQSPIEKAPLTALEALTNRPEPSLSETPRAPRLFARSPTVGTRGSVPGAFNRC